MHKVIFIARYLGIKIIYSQHLQKIKSTMLQDDWQRLSDLMYTLQGIFLTKYSICKLPFAAKQGGKAYLLLCYEITVFWSKYAFQQSRVGKVTRAAQRNAIENLSCQCIQQTICFAYGFLSFCVKILLSVTFSLYTAQRVHHNCIEKAVQWLFLFF